MGLNCGTSQGVGVEEITSLVVMLTTLPGKEGGRLLVSCSPHISVGKASQSGALGQGGGGRGAATPLRGRQ